MYVIMPLFIVQTHLVIEGGVCMYVCNDASIYCVTRLKNKGVSSFKG